MKTTGIIIGVLAVAFLVYWFGFRKKNTPQKVLFINGQRVLLAEGEKVPLPSAKQTVANNAMLKGALTEAPAYDIARLKTLTVRT